ADWFYKSQWEQARLGKQHAVQRQGTPYLIFADTLGIGEQVADRLIQDGQSVIRVQAGTQFVRLNEQNFTIRPGEQADYQSLVKTLGHSGQMPGTVLHFWSVTAPAET